MRQLSGTDADMLYAETDSWHLHVGGLLVIDPSGVPGGFDCCDLRRLVEHRAAGIPALRQRVVEVPFGIDRPYWADDPDFDIDAHVHRVRLPAPGGRRELAEIVGEVIGHKLERGRPLWEMWCVEGLAGGHLALVAKIHHAVADGVGGALLMGELLGLEPEPVPEGRPRQVEAPALPSAAELLVRSAPSLAAVPWRLARATARTASSLRRLVARPRPEAAGAEPDHRALGAPRAPFTHEVTPARSFAFTSISLDDVRRVKKAIDATVNDVVLTVCGGALRSYLLDRGELPDEPLVAAVPVSVRGDGDAASLGNLVSGWFASLGTDVADPFERLHAVRDAARRAKATYDSGIEDAVMDWAAIPPPALWWLGVRMFSAAHVAERIPPLFNLLVSNVPGSPVDLYAGPARVVATYPFGPLLGTAPINITVLGYRDSLDVGITACPDLVPDVEAIADALAPALAELVDAAAAGSPS